MAMAPAARSVSSSAPPSFRAKKRNPVESPHEQHPPAGPKPQNGGRMTGPPMQKGAGQGSMFANGKQGQSQGAPPRRQEQLSRTLTETHRDGPGKGWHVPPVGASTLQRVTTETSPDGPNGTKIKKTVGFPQPPARPAPMMADGDPGAQDESPFGATPPIGGMPEDLGDPQAGAPVGASTPMPSPDGGGGPLPVIKPEAVAYHDDPHSCQGCMYFGQDSNCAVLQMQVSPEGGCNAFEAGGSEPDADDMNDPSGGFGAAGGTGAGFTQNPAGTSGAPSLS